MRLEETEGQIGAYISVSHRWKERRPLYETTSATYSQRKLGRDLDNLPELFIDIFNLAVVLEIPFVWIDCLCIIQDSPKDWQDESLRMGDYYLYSRFTLAVTAERLFEPNILDVGAPRLAQLPYRNRSGLQCGYFYVFPVDYGLKQRYRQQISQSELLTRGWVFQEW